MKYKYFNVTEMNNLSKIQECYLILAKFIALEKFDINQSNELIKLVIYF